MRSIKRFLFSFFMMLIIFFSVTVGMRNYTTIMVALMTLFWHFFAYMACSTISSYRFKKPTAKYVEIENDVIRKIFVRPFSIGEIYSASKDDKRINIVGLVLNAINILMFVSFEIFLFLPKIPCDAHVFSIAIPTRRHHYEHISFELDSLNEVIPAEISMVFMFITVCIWLAFYAMFARELNKRTAKNKAVKKVLENTEWHYPLYCSLIDISVRRSNKKHKFWYKPTQIDEIGALVNSAAECAELKFEKRGDKMFLFKVIDTVNDHTVFVGYFV